MKYLKKFNLLFFHFVIFFNINLFANTLNNKKESSLDFFEFILISFLIILLVFIFNSLLKYNKLNKQLEENSRELDVLKKSVEQSFVSTVITDVDGNILYVNKAFEIASGYSKSEVLGKTPRVLKSGLTPEETYKELWKTVLNGKAWHGQFINKKKSGEIYYEDVVISPVLDNDGAVVNFIGIKKDITEVMSLMDNITENEMKLKSIVGNIREGIATVSKDNVFTFVNKSLAKILGETESSLIGKSVFNYLDEKSKEKVKNETKKRLTGETSKYRISIIRKDGEKRVLEVSAVPQYDNEGKIIGSFGTFDDVTERIKIESELQKSRQLESIGKLAGGIAHDFNNLNTIILGNIELAKQWNKDEEIDSILQESIDSLKQAQELTSKLLTFSKGGFVRKKRASINEIIEKLLPTMKIYRRHKISVSIPKEIDNVEIDEKQIKVVFEQLIQNALDVIEDGGTIDIKGEVCELKDNEISTLKKGKYLKISIKDSGKGVAEQDIDNIFNPYFTTKQMGNKKGTGMGLSTCFSVLRKHDGAIVLEDTSEKGTTFALYFPY